MEISQNFVAFSEYMNFKGCLFSERILNLVQSLITKSVRNQCPPTFHFGLESDFVHFIEGWTKLKLDYLVPSEINSPLSSWIKERYNAPAATDKRTDVLSLDFIIWKINSGLWAVVWAGLWNKRVWADYEQLLRPVFQFFYVQKINLKFFLKIF